MKPTIHWDVEQGSPDWYALKAGKWSSSKAAIIMGGPETKGLDSLIKDIAWGRRYGPIEESFRSGAMERGSRMEPESRDWYALEKLTPVLQAGLVEHATIPHVAWSPDGLIEPGGGIEGKCPLHKAFMEVKRTGKIPAEYRWQCKWGMWVGQLDYLDFVCYHPLAGGLIVPAEVTESEKQQMEERVYVLEKRVAEWLDILDDRKAA